MKRSTVFLAGLLAVTCVVRVVSAASPWETLSKEVLNISDWAFAGLDQTVPPEIRQSLSYLREDLLDESKSAPQVGAVSYKLGSELCNFLIAALDEREQARVRAGFRTAQANAATKVTSPDLEVRRNYTMSWPQYARELSQRSEIQRQQNNQVSLAKEAIRLEWADRVVTLRRNLDDLYRQYRVALRQDPNFQKGEAPNKELTFEKPAAPVPAVNPAPPAEEKPVGEKSLVELIRLLVTNKTEVIQLGGGVQMEFVLIPHGSFVMKSETVTFDVPFYMGKYKVTQEQWETIMGTNPSHFIGPKRPVETVTWYDCQDFLKNLQVRCPGRQFSLPTRAQWEYAARAGSTNKLFFFGDDASKLGDYAWYADNSGGMTHPVGEKKPNPWGLYDIHGNCWEWSADVSPPTPTHHWLKGGGWKHPPGGLKFGSAGNWRGRTDNIGFRVLMTAGPPR